MSTSEAESELIRLMDEQMKVLAEEMNRRGSSGKYELTLSERMKAMGSIQDWLMKRRRLLGEAADGDENVDMMHQNAALLRQVAELKERLQRYAPGDGGPPIPPYKPKGGRPTREEAAMKERRRAWAEEQGLVAKRDPDDSTDLDKQLEKLKGKK